jgi:hypothetical protein
MSDNSIDPSDAANLDPHADKYNDPRAKITGRGLMLGLLVVVLGIVGAAGSIYARRTRLEKTTEYWGSDTITALQLGEKIEMLSISGRQFEPVELTRTPGLGHLRHLLLDERNYDWSTISDQPIGQRCEQAESFCVQLRITDPTAHRFAPVELTADLNNGWLGDSAGPTSIRIAERKRNALKKFLEQLISYQQRRYDQRD